LFGTTFNSSDSLFNDDVIEAVGGTKAPCFNFFLEFNKLFEQLLLRLIFDCEKYDLEIKLEEIRFISIKINLTY
jgi:hypothetical protein